MKTLLGMVLAVVVGILTGSLTYAVLWRLDSPALGLLTQLSAADRGCSSSAAFTQQQMPAYLECIIPLVSEWNDTVGPRPEGYYMVPRGIKDSSFCSFDEYDFLYCSNGMVFVGEAEVWRLYSALGTAAVPAFLAHEITHHLQYESGRELGSPGSDQIPFENQADCGAGAFMAWAVEQGIFTTADASVVADVLRQSGQEGPGSDHGTSQQRLDAFNAGYTSPLTPPIAACEPYAAGTTLHR